MRRFRYYDDGPSPERARRPAEGESFFRATGIDGAAAPRGLDLVGPDDPGINFVGRFAPRSPSGPVFVWQGSQLLARFEGRRIGFRFGKAEGQNHFNVIVDGDNRLLSLAAGGPTDYLADFALGPGEHELVLAKRSEGYFGSAVLAGLLLEEGSSLGPRPEPLPLRIEFYGDSITAGACDDDPAEDQYEDLSTHDHFLSYGSIACRALGAEQVSIAVSGTGITCSWNPVLMPEIWDRVAPDPGSARWDFSGRAPDVVVVNLGQNDFGLPHSVGGTLAPDFAARYADFVRGIRIAYPRALIVCAIGGMTAWRASSDLRRAWRSAMAELAAGDPGIAELRLEARSEAHPRVPIHRALAMELESFIRAMLAGRPASPPLRMAGGVPS